MITTTTSTTTQLIGNGDYQPGEALTALMTAEEWTTQFDPGTIEHMNDVEYEMPGAIARAFAALTERGHNLAHGLGLPRSETGAYPPVVWELEAAWNR